jgi:hypothetical protein
MPRGRTADVDRWGHFDAVESNVRASAELKIRPALPQPVDDGRSTLLVGTYWDSECGWTFRVITCLVDAHAVAEEG